MFRMLATDHLFKIVKKQLVSQKSSTHIAIRPIRKMRFGEGTLSVAGLGFENLSLFYNNKISIFIDSHPAL